MRSPVFPVLLVFLICFIFSTPVVHATYTDSVIRPGAYFVYVARTNESVNVSSLAGIMGSGSLFFSLELDNEPVSVNVYGNGSVEFRIASVKDGMATVQVIASGTDALIRYSGSITQFWDKESVISTESQGNTTLVAVRDFSITREYKMNIYTGEVYDLKGRSYGRTLLLYNQNVKPKLGLFTAPNGLNVSVFKVTTINMTVITYYKRFLPPLIQVITTPYAVSSAYITAKGKSILIYDPGSGILLSYFGFSWADFQAAGFSLFGGFDRSGSSVLGKDKMFAPGLVLAETNVLGSVARVRYSPKTSPLIYVYLVSLLLAVTSALLEAREWEGS